MCTARFIGTQYSTFSSYIVRLRGFVGAPDTRTYYHTQAYTAPAGPRLDAEIARLQPIVHGQEYIAEHPAFWRVASRWSRSSHDEHYAEQHALEQVVDVGAAKATVNDLAR